MILNPTNLGAGSIGTEQLAVGSVTEPKLANGAVAQAKVAKATIPATGAAEGEIGLGAGGVGRTEVGNLNAKAEKGPYTFKHQQGLIDPTITAYNKTKKAVQAIEAMEIVNENEVKITFTAAPAAKDEILLIVIT